MGICSYAASRLDMGGIMGLKMARTTELKTKVEPFVREWLAKNYHGHTFEERTLPLRKKRDGTYAVHKFDAVSDDNSIVASIKSHSWLTSGGHLPSGKIGQIYQSLYFLSLVEAKRKLLVFTDTETYQGFAATFDGKVADDIEIKLCPLSQELRQVVDRIYQEASREMRHR